MCEIKFSNFLRKKLAKGYFCLLIILFILVFLPETKIFPQPTGAIFLKEAIGARQIAMGEAFVSIVDDVTSLYYNPAGLANMDNNELTTMYTKGIMDISYAFVGCGISKKKEGSGNSFGIGLFTLQGGDIEIWESEDISKTVKVQQDYVLTVGYARTIFHGISLGINLKTIQSTLIEQYNATTSAIDLGLLFRLSNKLKAGISMQNIGSEIKYESQGSPLPLAYRYGIGYVAYDKDKSKDNIIVSGELLQYSDSIEIEKHIGIEYLLNNIIALRAGYKTESGFNSVLLGAGLRIGDMRLDYTQSLNQEIDIVHWVSFTIW